MENNIMTLPKLTLPKYNLNIPSTEKNISFRPFLVREEKALLMAFESEDIKNIITAMKDIIQECTFGNVDANELPLADMCFIFLNIRAKSVGEIAEPSLTCESCNETNSVSVDLTEVKITKDENHSNKIELDAGKGIIMKYPTLSMQNVYNTQIYSPDNINFTAECIDMIYDGDKVYKSSEYTTEELIEFIDGLTHSQFDKILEFFETMPKLSHDVEFECIKCNHKNKFTLEGIRDFFL